MLLFALIAAASVGIYVAVNNGSGASSQNPNMPQSTVSGSAGSVTVGSQPTTLAQLQGNAGGPSTSQLVGFSAGAATTGTALAAGTGLIKAGGSLAKAVPVVGAVIGIGLGIYEMISQHHKAAMAAEGKALNDATPRMVQTFTLIVQAVMAKEIRDVNTAQSLCDQTVAAWYGEVKPIQRGTWHYTGADMTADYDKVWVKRTQPPQGAPGYSDYHAPDPCNAACMMGHFFAERNSFVTMAAVKDILAGKHGTATFPTIPPYATQQGYPQVQITY